MSTFSIYKITNLVNGKIYIGQTKLTIEERFQQHKYNANSSYKKSRLYSAMKKYGVDNFSVKLIDEAGTQEESNEKEIDWINFYKSNIYKHPNVGYNMTDGGGGISGYQLSEDHKQKISEAMKGMVCSEERVRKISESKMGHEVSDETREKIRQTKLSNPYNHSEETKEKLRQSSTGKQHTQEAIEKIIKSKLGKKRTPEQCENISKGHKGQIPWNKSKSFSEEYLNTLKWNNLRDRFKDLLNHNYMFNLVDNFEINKLNFYVRDDQYELIISFLIAKLEQFKNQRGVGEEYQDFRKKLRKLRNDMKKIDFTKVKEVS
jgi:group I intron endonuclease